MIKQAFYTIAIGVALSAQAMAQDAPIFPKGEKAANVNHIGNVWLKELNEADKIFTYTTSVATFDAGARLNWHMHPGGQVLMITAGIGYYQERGKPKQLVRKGDVVKCLPGIEHWHGATPESGVTYLATSPVEKGKTKWLTKVSEEEYHRPAITSAEQEKSTTVDSGRKTVEQELIKLSKDKWLWMADKKVDSLASLFHDQAVFVHMGGSMTRDQELNVIKSGGIHYKHAEIQDSSVQVIGNTAILLNKVRLVAVVGGNEITNPFVVTEVYMKEDGKWRLGSMSFTRLLKP